MGRSFTSARLVLAGLLSLTNLSPVSAYYSSWYQDYYPQPGQYCAYACKIVSPYITFNVVPTGNFYVDGCTNNIKLQSLYACAQTYCSQDGYRKGIEIMNTDCVLKAGVTLPSADELALSPEALAAIPRLDSASAFTTYTSPLNETTIPDMLWHAQGVRTARAFYSNWNFGFVFSWGMYGFWGLVLLIGIINRLFQMFNSKSVKSGDSKATTWLRKNLILPPTFARRSQEPTMAGTIPPRLETLVIVLYILMNVIMCFPGYDLFIGNQNFPAKSVQVARSICDRTGMMALGQLPIVWVFASRNDPFLWLTGWSFATFNRFHRWVARLLVLLVFIHAVAWSVSAKITNLSYWNQEVWYTGVIAMIVLALMIGISFHVLRQKFYDFFLILHISFAVIALVTTYLHLKVYPGQFVGFIWPCVAMWAIDRILRVVRILRVCILSKSAKATATYNSNTNMIRLDVTEALTRDGIVPGLYYYVYMPTSLRGYESHPFTLCSWHAAAPGRVSNSPPNSGAIPGKETFANPSTTTDNHNSESLKHTFLIRPYDGKGFTNRLRQRISKSTPASEESASPSKKLTILLEGPYRHKLDLSRFSDVLFVCGGSGITPVISHTHFILSANTTTKMHIHWAVPQRSFPDDVCANELAAIIRDPRLHMTVYLTAGRDGRPVLEEEKTGGVVDAQDGVEQPYTIAIERPDVELIMRRHRVQASQNLAIVTCGPSSMADACRVAVCRVLDETESSGKSIEYFDETLVW